MTPPHIDIGPWFSAAWSGFLTDPASVSPDCGAVALSSAGALRAGYLVISDDARCFMLDGTTCGPSWTCGNVISVGRVAHPRGARWT